jgi:hypothetical protein
MAEFTASHFADLCSQAPVQEQIRTIEDRRRAAVSRFWMVLLGGTVGALVVAFVAGSVAGGTIGWILFVVLMIGVSIIAWNPLSAASQGIKLPTLHALAAQGGMTYMPSGFEPPVLGEARQPLFGGWLSSCGFTDLLYGTDPEGRNFAFYEGTLNKGHGKHKTQVFSGQFYAFQRRDTQQGAVVAVPDRGLFNFFKPSGGYQRMRFEADPEFEKKFEVYATDPNEAAMLFGSMALRRTLIDLRQTGRIFLYVGPSDVLAAVTGPNRFEPGSMFKSKDGEERVRLMFSDVCASLDILKRLQTVLA